MESQLKAIIGVGSVERIAGADRYGTAAAAAAVTRGEIRPMNTDASQIGNTAYIVTGSAWPDALAAGAVAAYQGVPILLSNTASVPASTTAAIQDLGISNIIVVGGTSAISPAAYATLEGIVGSDNTTRVAGNDRYGTARAIAQWGIDQEGMSGYSMTLCSGENFPDALSAGVMSYWTGSPLLLTPSKTLSPSVTAFMDENHTGMTGPEVYSSYYGYTTQGESSWCIGGTNAISESVFQQWASYVPKAID